MPPRRSRAAVVTEPEAPAPAAGHNSVLSDEALISENHTIDDQLKAAAKKLDEWSKPLKERRTQIEDDLFGRLNERGSSSTSTDAGTAYISTLLNTKVEDATKLFDFLADHWDEYGADIQINISKDAVKRFMEASNGLVPPGMSISHFSRLNIRRS